MDAQASAHPPVGRPPCSCRARSLAVASADRFPLVPPATNTPAASAGQPSRSASQRSTWFSAKIAPAPVSHRPPNTFAALTAVSKATAARVGALGMYARFIGSSAARVAGSSTCSYSSIARAEPIPPGVIVCPTSRARASALRAVAFGSEAIVVCAAAHCRAALTASVSSPQIIDGLRWRCRASEASVNASRSCWVRCCSCSGAGVPELCAGSCSVV